MGDPFTVAVSVAGLLSLGIQVTQSLVDFYASYKDRDSNLTGTTQELESLLDILQHLSKALASRKFEADERGLVERIENAIKDCEEAIKELDDECKKFEKASPDGRIHALKVAARKLTYPFRRSTLQKIDENVGELRTNVSLALTVLQLKDSVRAQDDIDDIKALVTLIKARQIAGHIQDWLKAPDASTNHNEACAKKHPGTGTWFVKSNAYTRWLTGTNTFLWLQGFAGCGKSVLFSTVVQSVFRHRRSDPRTGIAFFYFTFNDQSKQDEPALLRTWLLQLASQLEDGYKDLTKLYESYRAATPPSPVLLDYLRRLIDRFGQVYLLVDALDESPRNRLREKVLDTLEVVRSWGLEGVHLFVTSRDELDIREFIDTSIEEEVAMRNGGIDDDIANYISSQLTENRRLRNWLPHRDKIQDRLTKGARGVFRWVECQFKSLQTCPRSEYHLDRMLSSLPESLDETYERMLCKIDRCSIEDARRVLILLCFAARPLTVHELIEGIAVEIEDGGGLNQKRRLLDANDIHGICPGLVEISIDSTSWTEGLGEHHGETVRIAHFSVQEYLESERIRHQQAAIFSLSSATAHAEISHMCLLYLLEPALSNTTPVDSLIEAHPLGLFAAKFWYHHYQDAGRPDELNGIIVKLFQRQDSFSTWVRLHDIDHGVGYRERDGSPIYYASFLGLDQVLDELTYVKKPRRETELSRPLPYGLSISQLFISAKSQFPSNSPQVESMSDCGPVVQHLQENNSNFISQNEGYNTALQKITSKRNDSMVELLPDKGTDVNTVGGHYGNALQAASFKGHNLVVQLLLDKGADVNARGGEYGNALQAASSEGHKSVVQLLLDERADVNAQGGWYGYALHAASFKGHESVVQLLLDRGAGVNAQGGEYGYALEAASFNGHESVVQLLLDEGADVNARGGHLGNALQAAANMGRNSLIQLLLDKGADINAQGGRYGNALQAASCQGRKSSVELLLDKGADIHAQGGYYGNALQAASSTGHNSLVQLLLDEGADVNAQGGEYGYALQAASFKGHESVVQLLLDGGADVNAQGGEYGNALQAASSEGRKSVVQLLLDKGADVNAKGGYFGNALYAALSKGDDLIIKLLLDKGADANSPCGWCGNALQTASYYTHESIVQVLLNKGADVNAQCGWYGNALQAASAEGQKSVVQLLLDEGAHVNAQGGWHGTALQAASDNGHRSVVQLLVDKGADVNLRDNALQAAISNDLNLAIRKLLRTGGEKCD